MKIVRAIIIIFVLLATVPVFASDWPQYLGPSRNSVSDQKGILRSWPQQGPEVLWTVEVGIGFGGPVSKDGKVYLLDRDDKVGDTLRCFDLSSGKELWNFGYKAPGTVMFPGSRSVPAVDGNKVWEKDLGRSDNTFGYACSLVMFRNLLLIQFDQGAEEDQKSMMIAIDGATGNFAWQKERPVGTSWATLIIINAAGKNQLITCGNPWVIAYNPADGIEMWRAKCLSGYVAISPIYTDGIVVVIDMYNGFIAIRPDGSGDVTNTHIAWSIPEGTPEISSPISKDGLIFILIGDVYVACFRSSDGKELWEQRMKSYIWASPSLAGDRLFLLSVKGEMFIIEAGAEYKELAKCELYEACFATPAFVDGRIYIRGYNHLYCIGEKV